MFRFLYLFVVLFQISSGDFFKKSSDHFFKRINTTDGNKTNSEIRRDLDMINLIVY